MKKVEIIDAWLSYYGAYIDGEGHIGIQKVNLTRNKEKGYSPSYTERVSVSSTNELIIRSFNDIVIGHINYCKGSKLSQRGYWTWEVTNKKAREFLRIIEPYLKTKNLQAKIVLALGRNKEKTKSKRLSSADLKLREDLYIVLKGLHHV